MKEHFHARSGDIEEQAVEELLATASNVCKSDARSAQEALQRATQQAQTLRSKRSRALALANCGVGFAALPSRWENVKRISECIVRAQDLVETERLMDLLVPIKVAAASVQIQLGVARYRVALPPLKQALDIAQQGSATAYEGLYTLTGIACILTGDARQGIRYIERGAKINQQVPSKPANFPAPTKSQHSEMTRLCGLAAGFTFLGEFSRALSLCEHALHLLALGVKFHLLCT